VGASFSAPDVLGSLYRVLTRIQIGLVLGCPNGQVNASHDMGFVDERSLRRVWDGGDGG
jgi:hypothetical protein